MTTTPTPWAHLPNAAHIDRILAHVKAHGGAWLKSKFPSGIQSDDWRNSWAVAKSYGVDAQRGQALAQATTIAYFSARAAVDALIAWDDCAYLLDLHPDALAILIHTAPEPLNHQAMLLLPAAIALNT